MKICVISTTIMTCPPPGYSGLEMLAWQQAMGLAKKGHEVLLVAPTGSMAVGVEIHGTTLMESEKQAYSGYWQRLPDFDCIIDNSWQKWSYILKMEGKLKTPILGVLHAPVETMYGKPPPVEKPCFVAISKDQQRAVSQHLRVDSRVAYNGVDVDFYNPKLTIFPSVQRNDRYLFLARMSSVKGPDIAVNVAKNTGQKLDVVGDDTLTAEPQLVEYVKNECRQRPDLFRYIGPQTRNQCVEWFAKNKALIHPNKIFREPFGLAPVEAQLCGMPVIAWDNGAMRETISHKDTGFLVSSQEEMEALVRDDAVKSIDGDRCREWASQFSYHNMIDRYENLCIEAVEGGW